MPKPERKSEKLSGKNYERIGRAAFKLMQYRQSGESDDKKALLRAVRRIRPRANQEANRALEMTDALVEIFSPLFSPQGKGRKNRS